MDHFLKLVTSLMLGLASLCAQAGGTEIQVADPWVQTAPPGAKVMAAYLEIKNTGDKPQALVGVSSPAFTDIGIHKTVIHGNMAHMEHLKELPVPARASVVLKPGGLHLMLTDGKKPLREGDTVPMTLQFKSGDKAAFTATVRSAQTEDAGGHQHHKH
jgi:copper(I)-binding protein